MSNLKTSLKIGLQIMEALARAEDHPVSVRELSAQLNQSEKYLEQLMLPLRRSRLLVSMRGPHGGYQLSRPPGKITLLEIMMLMQGPLTFCDCPNRECGECVSPTIWQTLETCIETSIAAVTLADVMASHPLQVPDQIALTQTWVRDGLGI